MVSATEAYIIGYAEVGSAVDGWVTTNIGGAFPAMGDPPTLWTIEWFDADRDILATVKVDPTTGDIVP